MISEVLIWEGFGDNCDWIWENPPSTSRTQQQDILFTSTRLLYTLANISARYQCWKLPKLFLLWLVSASCQTSTSAGVIFKWLHLQWTSSQPAINATRLAGEFGHGFSYIVWYVEVEMTLVDAIWLFLVKT